MTSTQAVEGWAMLGDNPVTRAIATMAPKIAALDSDALANVEDSVSLDMSDWLELGDKSSRALLAGLVDAETAQTLHIIHTNYHTDATLAEKVVFLQAMREILGGLRRKYSDGDNGD